MAIEQGDGHSEALASDAQAFLLALARSTIANFLVHHRIEPPVPPLMAQVQRPMGCFVSLHERRGGLRGCIGTFSASQPLWSAVQEMAVSAATRDPRFLPLEPHELEHCVIEISALGQPREVAAPDAVRVGEHGLWLVGRGRSGVLLPQVATQYQWDRQTFLQQTCRKAGLPADAWRDSDIKISVFTAQVFADQTARR